MENIGVIREKDHLIGFSILYLDCTLNTDIVSPISLIDVHTSTYSSTLYTLYYLL